MKKVSFIIPCYNEEQALPIFAGELDKVRQELRQYDFEVLMVMMVRRIRLLRP